MLLGNVEVSRVVEFHGAFGTTDVLFPSVPGELWRRHESWLAPDFLNAETGEWLSSVQTWVLRSAGRTVLVDTGLGHGKAPEFGAPDEHGDDLLGRLAATGVRPDEVDLVINTHLHDDHVGWNTRFVDGEWVPTFPHAQYLISRADFDF